MQKGVAIRFTAVATVDSDTLIGSCRYLFTTKNENNISVVLNPGMGNIPNQNPYEIKRSLSIQVICFKGVMR